MRETASSEQARTMTLDLQGLNAFIVRAKAATYVGDGQHVTSSRAGSHDLRFTDGEWSYHDSYFGGADFLGEEVVYWEGTPVWAMNYYGRILREELLTAAQAGQMIKASLSRMYGEGRFLGGFVHTEGDLTYIDASEGNTEHFHGREVIRRGEELAYELLYHGGMIRD